MEPQCYASRRGNGQQEEVDVLGPLDREGENKAAVTGEKSVLVQLVWDSLTVNIISLSSAGRIKKLKGLHVAPGP